MVDQPAHNPSSGSRSTADDDTLMQRLRDGNVGAAAALTRRYWDAIWRFAANYLGDESLAEDVTQDTFAKLLNPELLPEGAVRPWLYKVARNRCLDIIRRHGRSPTHNRNIRTGFDAQTQTAGPQTRMNRDERQALIRQIIDQMPDDHRSVLMLKYFEGLSREEIAGALELTDAAVKGRLARASEALRSELARITGTWQ
ncbi:MAG: sigma-70 family RNA polymerase sigma factor [Phycisphaerales bacterium]|nr:sigma-70 family RNA polymerase sigma factor [Phycisphaerales bacterium]